MRALQAHSVALAFHCMFFSLNALWFSNSFSCWSYMSTWLGLLPMQLVAAAVAWENAWLFMPKVPDEDPLVQVPLPAALSCYHVFPTASPLSTEAGCDVVLVIA